MSSPIAAALLSQPPAFCARDKGNVYTEVGMEMGAPGYIAEIPANPHIKSAQRTKMGVSEEFRSKIMGHE
jgi:hypothetical protein